jgi:biotin transport system substrate-specific component
MDARYAVFKWRYDLAVAEKIILSFAMAVAVAVLAQVRVPLPWSPVPITGSTFGAVFAGVLLGNVWGGVSMLIYLALGAIGLPVFTGFKSGIGALVGPTGGYLVGFAAAAFFMGYMTDNFPKARKFLPMLGLMFISNIVILALGTLNLAVWSNAVQGKALSFGKALWMGFIPFIPGDIIKSLLAAVVADIITPKQSYK